MRGEPPLPGCGPGAAARGIGALIDGDVITGETPGPADIGGGGPPMFGAETGPEPPPGAGRGGAVRAGCLTAAGGPPTGASGGGIGVASPGGGAWIAPGDDGIAAAVCASAAGGGPIGIGDG